MSSPAPARKLPSTEATPAENRIDMLAASLTNSAMVRMPSSRALVAISRIRSWLGWFFGGSSTKLRTILTMFGLRLAASWYEHKHAPHTTSANWQHAFTTHAATSHAALNGVQIY